MYAKLSQKFNVFLFALIWKWLICWWVPIPFSHLTDDNDFQQCPWVGNTNIASHFSKRPPLEGQHLRAAHNYCRSQGGGKGTAQKDLWVKSPLWLPVLPVWMSDWKWIAPVSVHRQHICGLICLLLRKSEPWAVSLQWPHSRQNSGTVVLHVTVYNPPAHLHPRKQPSNLCGSSISACLKVPFQAECWSFRTNSEYDQIRIMTRIHRQTHQVEGGLELFV